MSKKTRILGAITVFAFILAMVAPTEVAAKKVTIKDNGKDSINKVIIKKNKKTRIRQSNRNHVRNYVIVKQNTGGNKANGNTNGNVTVKSGKATTTITNKTTTTGNEANYSGCECEDTLYTITIKDNGKDSTNIVRIRDGSMTSISQSNKSYVSNSVMVMQNTGHNTASGNTDGTVDVDSGNAEVTVKNTTTTGGNTLNP